MFELAKEHRRDARSTEINGKSHLFEFEHRRDAFINKINKASHLFEFDVSKKSGNDREVLSSSDGPAGAINPI